MQLLSPRRHPLLPWSRHRADYATFPRTPSCRRLRTVRHSALFLSSGPRAVPEPLKVLPDVARHRKQMIRCVDRAVRMPVAYVRTYRTNTQDTSLIHAPRDPETRQSRMYEHKHISKNMHDASLVPSHAFPYSSPPMNQISKHPPNPTVHPRLYSTSPVSTDTIPSSTAHALRSASHFRSCSSRICVST